MKKIASDAAAMAGAVRAAKVSARELLDTCLARIAATDAQVNASTSQTLARAQLLQPGRCRSRWVRTPTARSACPLHCAAMGLLTQPISFAGCPVVTAPMWPASTNGLPGLPGLRIGLQIMAVPWREDLAFRAAQLLSQAGVAFVQPAAGLELAPGYSA